MKCLITIICLINISYAQTYTYDTVAVNTGWNLIGAVENGAITNIISTSPPGIIISSFFGYRGLYFAEDTLTRGKGYWVKVSEPGAIQFQIQNTTVDPCDGVLTVYYEGKTYNTVAIGDQCWLRENLNVGTRIPSSQNPENNGIIEKYCYNNDSINCILYGGLYQWNETMQYTTTPFSQGICPTGWHIPVLPEFVQTLALTVGYNGNSLKAIGQGYSGGAGTNTSGFSALLAGWWYGAGGFVQLGIVASVWSSTEYPESFAGYMELPPNVNSIYSFNSNKAQGRSVRCLKDYEFEK